MHSLADGNSSPHAIDAKAAPNGIGRINSLDGLRGIAAGVVMIHHILLTSPVLAVANARPSPGSPWSWTWWLTFSPLHLFWDGTQAVFVFFVLSGYVLAVPSASGRATRWAAYYPRRLVRLYLPVWAAVSVALLAAAIVPRGFRETSSEWTNSHVPITSWQPVVGDLTLVQLDATSNHVLWSLTWEVAFSLLLPLYLYAAFKVRRLPTVALVAIIGMAAPWAGNHGRYLPMFAMGVLLAFCAPRLRAAATRLEASGRARAGWVLASALCLLGLNASWYPYMFTAAPARYLLNLANGLEIVGAGLTIVLATTCPGWRRLLTNRTIAWLGSRSFSLYLVHEPIAISVALLLDTPPVLLTVGITVPIALLVGELFFRTVERPSIGLSRFVGLTVGRGIGPSHHRARQNSRR